VEPDTTKRFMVHRELKIMPFGDTKSFYNQPLINQSINRLLRQKAAK